MRKFLAILLLVAMPMAMMLTSCKDDNKEDENVDKTAAQIVAGTYNTKLTGTITLAAEGSEAEPLAESDATITLTPVAGKDDVVSLKLTGFKYEVSGIPINIPVDIAEVKVVKVSNTKATIVDEVGFTVKVITDRDATAVLNGTVDGKALNLQLDLVVIDMVTGKLTIKGNK